ncbi:MAG: threonine synthase, partial [Actinomycetota bacterium]
DGYYAIKAARETGGVMESVSDEEIVEGISLLARTEGIFTETAGGVTIATLRKLAARGDVRSDERTVALITGDGLKTIEAMQGHAGPTMSIPPSLDVFASKLEER